MIYVMIVCLIIIGILGFKLFQKQKIDKHELETYRIEVEAAKQKMLELNEAVREESAQYSRYAVKTSQEVMQLDRYKRELAQAREEYDRLVGQKMDEINQLMEREKSQRYEELDSQFETQQNLYNEKLKNFVNDCITKENNLEAALTDKYNQVQERIALLEKTAQDAEIKYTGLLAPLQLYEKEQQAKIYYTIQLPEEFREDIDYLLTVVSMKVQHPDIISKLVWTTYIKPYLDELCKRVDIRDEAGIYKITNVNSGKSYIGKSTNVKKRIQDHMKSVVGLSTIADQAVHHAILKEGFWNWTFEVITYCDKERLGELEKYYIDFFKTQEFGYNKREGG